MKDKTELIEWLILALSIAILVILMFTEIL